MTHITEEPLSRWECIKYELRNGTAWTVLDELWHIIESATPSDWPPEGRYADWRYRFCRWAHRDMEDTP